MVCRTANNSDSNVLTLNSPVPRPRREALASKSGNENLLAVAKVPSEDKTSRSDCRHQHDARNSKKHQSLPEGVQEEGIAELTALLSLSSVDNHVQSLGSMTKTWEKSFNVGKIAQGSYASILRVSLKDEPETYTIWKLMPLRTHRYWKASFGVDSTLIPDAAMEIKALELMNDVPGFVQLRSATVLHGPPTEFLLNIFKHWIECHPEDNVQVEWCKDQLWLLIEMTDAGTDLETLVTTGFPSGTLLNRRKRGARLSLEQAWDIFFLTADGLANGEEYVQFEHRDLHPGNICIRKKGAHPQGSPQGPSIDRSKAQRIHTYTDLEVTIIDYTLSRAMLEGEILANSMQDKAIFKQKSKKPNDQRQFDIYRWMRDIFEGTPYPKGDTTELWKAYSPISNVRWLHHLLTIILQETDGFGKDGQGYTENHDREMASTLARLRADLAPKNVLSCDYFTATDIVQSQTIKGIEKSKEEMADMVNYPHESQYMRTVRVARST